ncbi:MAG: hypothetical protein BRC36_03285 [Cyanobacteria bacterium QH_2_48_84]|nr:MAG: hypothetical protein BRC36_03285 [Cyanobacteria bacterium QH_2_48_84]PSP06770.1 MAG: hypothetical protein BRC54_06550 [Cyanobacteria bacterium SW_7_48_12]
MELLGNDNQLTTLSQFGVRSHSHLGFKSLKNINTTMPALRKIQSNNLINPYNLSPVFGDRELDKIAGKVCKWGSHALRFRQ